MSNRKSRALNYFLPSTRFANNIQVVAKGGKRKMCGTREVGVPMEEDDWEEPLQKLLKKEVQKLKEQGELEAIPGMPPLCK